MRSKPSTTMEVLMPKSRRSRLIALAAFIAVAAIALASSVVFAATKTVNITETDKYHFVPASINVTVGDTVHWQNKSDAPHTVSSDTGSDLNGSIDANTGSYDKTFDAAGTWKYHCNIHTYMHGTVVVSEAGVVPPPTDTVVGQSGGGSDGLPFAWLLVVAAGGLLGGLLVLRRLTALSDTRD
jgi:plastocyanin